MFQKQEAGTKSQHDHAQGKDPQVRASVRIDRIEDISIDAIETAERPLDSFDSSLTEVYSLQGYDTLPRSTQEAVAKGVKGWNGQAVSATELYDSGGGQIHLSLQPAPYFMNRAMRDATQSGIIQPEEQWEKSPRLVNVSALVIAPYQGQYHIFGQVKGNALGSGEVHAALAAGGLDARALQSPDPLRTALNTELLEEMGLPKDSLRLSPFGMMIDESNLGMVNFVALASSQKGEDIIEAYRAHVADRLVHEKDPEVRALAAMRIPQGLALQPLEGGMSLDAVRVITAEGEALESRAVRPYTDAIAEVFQRPECRKRYIEQAGL